LDEGVALEEKLEVLALLSGIVQTGKIRIPIIQGKNLKDIILNNFRR